MKLIKIALAGGISLLAMVSYAHAEAVTLSIAYSLFSGALGGVFSFSAIYYGIQTAAYLAALGGSLIASKMMQPKIDPGEWKNTFQENETSEYNAVGRVRIGGLKAFGNTKNNTISRLMWHVKGPMVAIERTFVGGREVVVEVDGNVSSPPWARKGGSWVNIKTRVGDGTETAWQQLMDDFPDLWTPMHWCRGIFQSLVRFVIPDFSSEDGNKTFQKLYQGGPPDVQQEARVAYIYDPRDSNQGPDSPSTWKWTDNGILCAAHIMRSYPDLKSSDFDWAFIANEANRADVIVQTRTGTEKRARCWGVWPSESRRGDVMQQVLESIGAEIVLNENGLIRIQFIEDTPQPAIMFKTSHITEIAWKSGPEAVERPNVCRIKYYSPERGYDMGEIDMTGIAWARIEDEITNYGEKYFDVELPFCPSSAQAQRIARRLFLRARADTGMIYTNMTGLAAWGVNYLNIEDANTGDQMLCNIEPPRINDKEGSVEIPYIVWPHELVSQPWNPVTMEALPPTEAPELAYDAELDKPAMPSECAVVQLSDGSFELRMKFSGVPGGTIPEALFRLFDGDVPNAWTGMEEYGGPEDRAPWYAWASVIGPLGRRGEFRVRFFNEDDDGSYFSDVLVSHQLWLYNAQPNPPTVRLVSNGDYAYSLDLSTDQIWVTTIVVEQRIGTSGTYPDIEPIWGPLATITARPGVTTRISAGSTTYWRSRRIYALTSDGTRSEYAYIEIPGQDNGS